MRFRRGFTKSEKGFTLVEMILAVAFLAVISVVMLQLFLHARNLGLKAHDLDQAVQISKSILETFKAGDDPSGFQSGKQPEQSVVAETDGRTTIRIYYDKNWKALGKSEADLSEKSDYSANVEVEPLTLPSRESPGKLYRITVQISKTKPYAMEKDPETELYRLTTEHYFGKK